MEVQREDVGRVEVRMEDMEVVGDQVEGNGEVEVEVAQVQMDGVDDVEYVEVVEDVEYLEVVDDRVEEVVEGDFPEEEIEYVVVVELPVGRAPLIYRRAGVTQPLPERLHVGALDRVCRDCNARHFRDEGVGRGDNVHFTTCCNNGQMIAAGQHALYPVPYLIQCLFTEDSQDGRNFREYVRGFNNALAFAAFTCDANNRRLPGRGPPVWIVHGQTYRTTNNEVAVDPGSAYNCQLYFLESAEANHRRLDVARRRNHELSEIVMGLLDGLLRANNPYAMAFM